MVMTRTVAAIVLGFALGGPAWAADVPDMKETPLFAEQEIGRAHV